MKENNFIREHHEKKSEFPPDGHYRFLQEFTLRTPKSTITIHPGTEFELKVLHILPKEIVWLRFTEIELELDISDVPNGELHIEKIDS